MIGYLHRFWNINGEGVAMHAIDVEDAYKPVVASRTASAWLTSDSGRKRGLPQFPARCEVF